MQGESKTIYFLNMYMVLAKYNFCFICEYISNKYVHVFSLCPLKVIQTCVPEASIQIIRKLMKSITLQTNV